MAIEDKITVCFATLGRPECAKRLIVSIKKHYPTVRVLVGEQVDEDGTSFKAVFDDLGAETTQLPFDYGVCATRNRLVAQVTTPYFVLCDDDFIWTEETRFDTALDLLAENADVLVVGGMLYDIYDPEPVKRNPRHWERQLYLDKKLRSLILFPIEQALPAPTDDQREVFVADAVMNFAVMRTAPFHDGLGWDEQFQSAGEHEDFFLNLKMNTDFVVLYTPDVFAFHFSEMRPEYAKLRNRVDGWQRLSEKWGVDHFIDGAQWLNLHTGEFNPAPSNFDDLRRLSRQARGQRQLPPGAVGITAKGVIYSWSDPTQKELSDLVRLRSENGSLSEEVRRLKYELDGARREREQILGSTSWRVTRPVRAAVTAFKRLASR